MKVVARDNFDDETTSEWVSDGCEGLTDGQARAEAKKRNDANGPWFYFMAADDYAPRKWEP